MVGVEVGRPHSRERAAGIIGVAVVLAGCSGAPATPPDDPTAPSIEEPTSPAQPPTPPPETEVQDRIAFVSDRDGDLEIYVMSPDGTGQTNLTSTRKGDSSPAWSPDGTKIAFQSNRDGNLEVYVMNADGSGQTNITNTRDDDYSPDWSPDGTRIAFASERDGDADIHVMNADGGGVIQLTDDAADEFGPDWSPDGRKIAFERELPDGFFFQIIVMDGDGSNTLPLLADTARFDCCPAWSPDGARIAFSSASRAPDQGIFVVRANGSGVRLVSNRGGGISPAWSPDGTQIVFVGDKDRNFDVYVVNADGTGLVRLTRHRLPTSHPTGSDPPERRIPFRPNCSSPRLALAFLSDFVGENLSDPRSARDTRARSVSPPQVQLLSAGFGSTDPQPSLSFPGRRPVRLLAKELQAVFLL